MPPLTAIFTAMLLAQAEPATGIEAFPTTAPATVPTTEPTLDELRAEHKAMLEKEFVDLPQRGKTTIDKLMTLSLESGYLLVTPKVDSTYGAVAYQSTDWPGWLEVAAGTPESQIFHFKHVDLSNPDKIATYTEVNTGPRYLQISRDSEDDKSLCSVSFIQSASNSPDDSAEPLRLLVHRTSESDAVPDFKAEYSAQSFEQLRREHPQEVRQYLGPILKNIGGASLLRRTTLDMAWQVLGADIAPDRALETKLKDIITRLQSPQFAARVAAEEELRTLDGQAAWALSQFDLSQLTADPKASIDNFIRAHQRFTTREVEMMRTDASFLLDAMLLENPTIQRAAAERLTVAIGKPVLIPGDLTPRDRELRIEALRIELMPTTQPNSP